VRVERRQFFSLWRLQLGRFHGAMVVMAQPLDVLKLFFHPPPIMLKQSQPWPGIAAQVPECGRWVCDRERQSCQRRVLQVISKASGNL
jgi:hypothetical protein